MIPTSELLHGLRPRIEHLGRRFGVLSVRVFGSVARGTAHEGSDIDLLVRMEPRRTLIDLIGFEQELGDELGLRVDVVEEGGIHPLLESTIMHEARPL